MTTTTLRPPREWDHAYVDEFLTALCVEMADTVNPQNASGVCLYETPDGSCRCLIGEMLHRHGITLRRLCMRGDSISEVYEEVDGLSLDIANHLQTWQREADRGADLPRWGDVPALVSQ